MQVNNQELQAFTLGWCNEVVQTAIRKAQGMSLHQSHFKIPRIDHLLGGQKQDSNGCVIARTLAEALGSPTSVSENTSVWMLGRKISPWMWQHPDYVNEFIRQFDGGGMPELDTDNSVHRHMEQERLRREATYREWQQDTRYMQAMYKGMKHEVLDVCDMPIEPVKTFDWTKELGLEGVAEVKTPETA